MWLYFFMAPPLMYWGLCVLSKALDLPGVLVPVWDQTLLLTQFSALAFYMAGMFPEAVVGIAVFAAFIVVLARQSDDRRARKWLAWGIVVTVLAYLVVFAPFAFALMLSTPGRPGFG